MESPESQVSIPGWKTRRHPLTSPLTEADVKAARDRTLKESEFHMERAEQFVAIFVGATRAGKSSLIKMLRNPFAPPTKMSIFSCKDNAKVHSFTVAKVDAANASASISCVDTPGLYEVIPGQNQEEARTQEAIMKCIGSCLDQNLRKVNCVFLVTKLANGRPSRTDVDTIRLFAALFGTTKGDVPRLRMAIIVTHSEDYTEDGMDRIEQSIRDDARLTDIVGDVEVEVLFSGVADCETRNYDSTGYIDALSTVLDCRSDILDFITESRTSVPLTSLSIAGSQQAMMEDKLAVIRQAYEELTRVGYEAWEHHRDVQDNLRDAVKYMEDNRAFLDVGSIMRDCVRPVVEAARALHTKYVSQVPSAELYALLYPFFILED